MEIAHSYTRKRADFGKHCYFGPLEAQAVESIASSDNFKDDFVLRNPSVVQLDTTPEMSTSSVNTERVVLKSRGMRHTEGGWPKEVDATEQSETKRYRTRTYKDGEYKNIVSSLGPVVGRAIKQNNTIDIYEEYFAGDVLDHSSEPPSAKGLAVFRDPNEVKRTATSICWHPEGPTKIAVSYSILNFQDSRMTDRLPASSYIWDVHNPNTPDQELLPASPLCCLRFNPKSPETLVGGSYNGLISFYDLRKHSNQPFERSIIEESHHDPVYDVFWISSKTGNLCASVSTDGQMLWWDTRRLGEPTERVQLENTKGQVLGGSSMEYNTEAGPQKYLVGTEQGQVMSIDMRKRKGGQGGITSYDAGSGKHHGPIYSIQRNPTHPKFFLTVGDWTARIWVEDLKTPIMTTKYHPSYLTSACWSPTRAGVFFVTAMDGVVHIWDYFYRQNEAAYTHKIGDAALSSISVQGTTQQGGRLVACGDEQGTVSLLEVCESLAQQQSNEKMAIQGMFERETKRERNLEQQGRERARRAAKASEKSGDDPQKKEMDAKMEETLRQVDAEFLEMIKKQEEEELAKPEEASA